MAGFSNVMENKVLDHIIGKTTLTITSPTYLALIQTNAVVETDTGSTITEANYTGYARKAIAAADMTAGSGGETHNSVVQTFAACTAGTNTIIGWALCTASTAGDVIMFGTCSATVISTTQTPPTIAISGLSLSLD